MRDRDAREVISDLAVRVGYSVDWRSERDHEQGRLSRRPVAGLGEEVQRLDAIGRELRHEIVANADELARQRRLMTCLLAHLGLRVTGHDKDGAVFGRVPLSPGEAVERAMVEEGCSSKAAAAVACRAVAYVLGAEQQDGEG